MKPQVEVTNRVKWISVADAALAAAHSANLICNRDEIFAIRIDYFNSTVRLCFQMARPTNLPTVLKEDVSKIMWESRSYYSDILKSIFYVRICTLYFDF